jgi:MinD superfamily P-loop ATPase
MKQLAVISGKGGTGKTSIVASFAALAGRSVLADCDVDAADLHLVMAPTVLRREEFSGGSRARIVPGLCAGCGQCQELCRFDAIRCEEPQNGQVEAAFSVDPIACEGCGVCAYFCPEGAIELAPATSGEWFISETRCGPMVHAKLGVAEANSGKLVSVLRTQAAEVAEQRHLDLLLIDGSPGVGCPVIASITGADLVLAVTEPTLAGLEDLRRVSDLTGHFGIDTLVCINKWDVNPSIALEIVEEASARGLDVAEMVRYDPMVTEAQMGNRSVVECGERGAAADIRRVWDTVCWMLAKGENGVRRRGAPLQAQKEHDR